MQNETIYLDSNQVPATIRGNYTGKHFRAIVTDSVFIPADAGLWSGGSRTTYRAVNLETGATRAASDNMSAPWNSSRKDSRVDLRDGLAIVSHVYFCGKDLGLTIYVNPTNAAALLPAPVELSPLARAVLKYTKERKSSYNGRDRFDMLIEDLRYGDKLGLDSIPTRDDWNREKAELIAGGFLNKAGAITTKGKNAAAR